MPTAAGPAARLLPATTTKVTGDRAAAAVRRAVLCGSVWRGGYGYGVWGLVVGVAGW